MRKNPTATSATLLGFDYGTKFIGVAVGSTLTRTARPLATLAVARSGQPDWVALTRLVEEWRPQALVVGLPLNMDDTPNPPHRRGPKVW